MAATTFTELFIYDADDSDSTEDAKDALKDAPKGTLAVEGVRTVDDLNKALAKYSMLKQVSICTHGKPGEIQFEKWTLNHFNLVRVSVPPGLFRGEGRLLFMGCEVAKPPQGPIFLHAAGKRFFGGKGGIVGGSTVDTWSSPFGTRLPWFSATSLAAGKLVLLKIDGTGKILVNKVI